MPSACAFAAFWCDRSANSSCSCREIPNLSTGGQHDKRAQSKWRLTADQSSAEPRDSGWRKASLHACGRRLHKNKGGSHTSLRTQRRKNWRQTSIYTKKKNGVLKHQHRTQAALAEKGTDSKRTRGDGGAHLPERRSLLWPITSPVV